MNTAIIITTLHEILEESARHVTVIHGGSDGYITLRFLTTKGYNIVDITRKVSKALGFRSVNHRGELFIERKVLEGSQKANGMSAGRYFTEELAEKIYGYRSAIIYNDI